MKRAVASWFGTGLIVRRFRDGDYGSGTVGAFFAAVIAVLIGEGFGWVGQGVAAAVVVLLGFWSIPAYSESEGDAGWIVVDEAAGAFVALIGLNSWPGVVVGFLVFRMADIFKNLFPGVASAERARGASGILADDLVAGMYGLMAGHIVQALL